MGLLQSLWTFVAGLFRLVLQFTGIGYYLQDLFGEGDSFEVFLKTRNELTKTLGTLHFPFFEGSFQQVKKEFVGREDHDLVMIVYCHQSNSNTSHRIIKNVLCDKETAQKFDRPDVINWMCDISNLTYYYLAQKLGFEGPYPAFLFLTEFKGKLKLEAAVSGDEITGLKLLDVLNEILSEFEIRRIMEEEGTAYKSDDQILREDQDLAYRMSLEADRKKREQQLSEEKAKIAEAESQQRSVAQALEKEKSTRALLQSLRSQIIEEPSAKDPRCVTISLQFPEGKRINRRFLLDSQVKDVYCFCAVELNVLPNQLSLKVPLPLTVLENQETSLKDYGISSNVKLLVEIID